MVNAIRYAGYIFIGFSIVLFVYLFWVTNYLLGVNAILHQSCNLDTSVCPFVGFPIQSVLGYVIDIALLITGIFFFIYSRHGEQKQKTSTAQKQTNIKSLSEEEKKIYEIILQSGASFQSDIVEKSGINKVKVSRMLDKLEGKGLVERRRRGMSNVIVPKQ